MEVVFILETFAVPRLESSCQSCRLCSLAAGDAQLQFRGLQPPGPAAQQSWWLVWRPKKEWDRGVSTLHTSQKHPGNAVESHLTPLHSRHSSYLRRPFPSSPRAHLLPLILEKVKNNALSLLEQNIFRISFPLERWIFRLCSNLERNKKLSGNVSISTETTCQILTYTFF